MFTKEGIKKAVGTGLVVIIAMAAYQKFVAPMLVKKAPAKA